MRRVEVEHDERADRAEREADRLEEHSEEVGEEIEGTRREWEAKESDASVPGAQPPPGEDEEDVAGLETELGERDEPMGG